MSKQCGRSIERVLATTALAAAALLLAVGCRTVGPTPDARKFALSGTMKGKMATATAVQMVEAATLRTLREQEQFDIRRASFDSVGFEITGLPRQRVDLRGSKMSVLSGKWSDIQMIQIKGAPGRRQAIITIGVHRSEDLSFDYETFSPKRDAELADLVLAFVTLYDLNVDGQVETVRQSPQ